MRGRNDVIVPENTTFLLVVTLQEKFFKTIGINQFVQGTILNFASVHNPSKIF